MPLPRPSDRVTTTSGRTIRFVSGVLVAFGLVAITSAVPLRAAPAAAGPSVPGVASQAANDSVGLRLVDVPADTADDPRARLYLVDHLAPGSVISRRIEVSNTTAAAVHVKLYPAAASIEKGSFIGAEGRTPNDLSTWTSIVPNALDLAAGEKVMATVMVTLPDDAPPGEQYAAVWAEIRPPASPDEGVVQVNRVGIRLYISIGPGGEPAADFAIESMTAERTRDGKPRIIATVRNTGGRALDMHGTLDLTDGPGGLSAGPFPASLGTTLATGATESVVVALDEQVPNGPWKADMVLKSGLVERRASVTLTFPDEGTSAAVTVPTEGPNRLAVVAIAITLAVAVLLPVARARRSRRRPRRRARHSRRPRHAKGRGLATAR
jgi:hypothetical protein